jgi:hypothetical protein
MLKLLAIERKCEKQGEIHQVSFFMCGHVYFIFMFFGVPMIRQNTNMIT